MAELTDDQKALVNETLSKAEEACQSVLDGLQAWSHDYDNGFGHACDACLDKIRALKIEHQKK